MILLKKQQLSFAYEVVVSDHQSTDNSVAVAQAFGCRVVHNTATGFSYGQLLNFGISQCRGEIIMLLSAHIALIGERSIENLVRPFDNEKVACVCGTSAAGVHILLQAAETRYITLADFPNRTDWKQQEGILLAAPCGAVRKSVWKQIKFSEALDFLKTGTGTAVCWKPDTHLYLA